MDKNARAVHQISLLTRGEDGKVVLPVGPIHGVTLESLGAVQPPDAPGFHSAAYILPVGYRTTRQYMRCDDPNGPHEVGSRDCSRRGRRRGQAPIQTDRRRGTR